MVKSIFRGVLLLFTITLMCSLVVHAEKNEQGESDKGTVIYHIKYDYDAISNFLGMSRDEYEQCWKEGFSIADMGKKQGISRRDITSYFVSLHYNEMQKWRSKGALSEEQYFDLVYRLADEVEDFIDRNPNRKIN
ncbi:hypothetical protein MKZ08_12990 [Viridibacillus sp. FSL R5-0477]|uniref:Uncharacterized protein n=1 Tax=Viridibacillus arenosi FSL R5-213 TaxID=1227360 RepID=W4EKR5_9BACL|nr:MULTISPECIES: hypothetical protein [Viridibacillus]ETT80582.1 hypothetical protein C176_21431 [Viridibacillus arenosi FSL R5-213]OMC82281.1 hypothetical protein BK128_20750 [Viridibacillus sp. FSL H7-0596]OMC87082.1 hypothetical protein BK137_20980 [Viridibacillus arenosi]